MKILSTLILILSISLVSMAQESKKEIKNKQKAESYTLIKKLVQSGEYKFVGIRANPQKGGQVDLVSRPNFMIINDGKATGDLPYFGVAHNPSYGGGDSGVMFDGTSINYQVEENDKKLKIIIKFRMKEKAEIYDCILTISSLDNATLAITSSRRSAISYYGNIKELEKDN